MPVNSQKERIIAALGPTLALLGSAVYFAGAIFLPLLLYWYLRYKKPNRYVTACVYALRSSDMALSVPIYILFASVAWMAIEAVWGTNISIAGKSGLFYLVTLTAIIYLIEMVTALIKAAVGSDYRFLFSLKIMERIQNTVMRSNNSLQPTQKSRG